MRPEVETDAVLACADLCSRAGARNFEVGYLDDNPDKPRWYAQAFFNGSRLIADEKLGPDEACDQLSRRILTSGRCTNCHKIVSVGGKKNRCNWHRDGPSWVRGCDGKRQATHD